MNSWILLPIFLGLCVVLQGVLNRDIGETWGLGSAVLLNAFIFFICALIIFIWGKWAPDSLPSYLRYIENREIKWWYVLPGICGFFLVLGLPWSMKNIGAPRSFILLITVQIVCSVLVDRFVYQGAFNMLKFAGALLAIAGSVLVVFG